MKEHVHKAKNYIFAHRILSLVILVVVLFIGNLVYGKITSTAGDTRYLTSKVERGAIVSTVSGTGQVSASNKIDIKPKVSGEVLYLAVENGQKVESGALIVRLDAIDAQKNVRDAEINLESARISLEKLKIQESAENMNADLIKAYDDGFSTVASTFLDLPSIVTGMEDILNNQSLADNAARNKSRVAQDYRNTAEIAYYTAEKAFELNRIYYRTLDRNSAREDMEKIIEQTYTTTKLLTDAIKSLRNYVDYMAEDNTDSPAFVSLQNTLSTYEKTSSGHLSDLVSTKTNIKDYKDAFINSDLDIQSSELSFKQKENALKDARDKLADYSIRAPFAGTVTAITIKKSDSVSTATIVATLITEKQLAEISLNEVDVAKIKVLV